MAYRILLTGLLVLIAGDRGPLSRHVKASNALAAPAVVPFELLKTMHMTVQIKINGKGPYRVIFDTGAPVVLLNNKVARESGVLGKNIRPPLFSPFGSMGQAFIKDLEVGGLKAAHVPVMVMDHPTVEMISKYLGPIEGIVGFPLFARYRMTIDYQAKQMTFVPNGYEPPDAIRALTKVIWSLSDEKPQILAAAGQWGLKLSKESGDTEPGVDIRDVLAGSAAAAAGLEAGDRLMTLDGRWTDSIEDAYRAAGFVKPGKEVRAVVRRGGRDVTYALTPRFGL